MKILFVTSAIQIGGFSKSLVYLIECLLRRGIKTDLMLLRRTDDEWLLEGLSALNIVENSLSLEFADDDRNLLTKCISMLRTGRIWHRLGRIAARQETNPGCHIQRRSALRAMQIDHKLRVLGTRSQLDLRGSYDCVVSWEESLCNYLVAARMDAGRKIGYIHPDYAEAGFDAPTDRRMLKGLDAIAFVAEPSRISFCRSIPELADRTVTLPNVLGVDTIRALADSSALGVDWEAFTIVTVCRLQNVSKALDRAARVCARMKKAGLRFEWFVIGAGPDRAMLTRLIESLGIENEMRLLGPKKNPYPYMKKADLFVLQSHYEGRPLAVDEAKILGTPVFVTDYASAREQVREGHEGFVVANSEAAIFEGLSRIVREPGCLVQIRRELSARAWDELTDCSPFLRACEGWLCDEV